MLISQQKRKENIAEYLLYMWQIEDLIRSFDCNIDAIEQKVISQFPAEQQADERQWFEGLITMMELEGKKKSGHLQVNTNILLLLAELHQQLLSSQKFPFYNAEYYKVLPFIVELRNKGDKNLNEIETCFDALYGVMMLRLRKKEISENTAMAIKEISTFIGMLSDYYKKDKTEGLEFE